MAMKRALVVEDDPDIVELISHYLAAEGFAVEAVADGARGLDRLRAAPFQAVVLDLQLPTMDGLTVCAEIRRDRQLRTLPVIMLTARGDESDRIVGLEVGADDYVVKPFSPKELVARLLAVMRRLERAEEGDSALVSGRLQLAPARHAALWDDEPVHLTAKEFGLLLALAEARG